MINYRIIARVFSTLLMFEGAMMLVSALVGLLFEEKAAASFLYAAIITVITGIIIFVPLRNEERVYGSREGYIIVSGIWVIFSAFGMLPFLFSGSISNVTDAFFESISGFTTTGATILTDIDSMPRAVLFWRSLTQWLGGVGVLFLSIYILPVFRDLNIQLSTTEFSGQTSDKIHPRAADAVKRLIALYAALTLAEVLLLTIGKMNLFDAVCHSFSTLSTGGFTTHNNSLSVYSSPFIKVVITLFMFIAGTNMSIIYFAAKADFKKIFSNDEFIFYIVLVLTFSVLISVYLGATGIFPAGESAINGFFHIVSVITTTGFYTSNYSAWGNIVIIIIFIMMFTGGTSGSASGGIKISRLMIMTRNNRMELRRLIHPNAYIPVRLNQKIISQTYVYNTMIFVSLYMLIICASAIVISLMGYDIVTSFGTSAAMLGNIGPGLGELGPFTTYAGLPAAGKWFMCILMLLGRLEIISLLILFSRSFYRK
jgi:trk system potassium uptake protein TrkH